MLKDLTSSDRSWSHSLQRTLIAAISGGFNVAVISASFGGRSLGAVLSRLMLVLLVGAAPGYLINFLLLCGIGVSGLYRLSIGFPGFSTFPGLGVEVWMGFTFLTAGVRDWSHCCSVLLQHPKEYSLRGSSLCFPLGYPRAWSTDLAWFTRFVGHTRSLRFIAEAFSHFILGIPFQARPKAHELCIHHCDETS